MICLNRINLLETFGDHYRVSIHRDSAEGSRDRDPWLQQIRCRRGLIYPYSATHLGVQVDHHPLIAQRLIRLGFQLIQDGDHEKTFIVPLNRFDEIAEIVQPYRRRFLSDEQRADAVARLAACRANARASPAAQSAIQVPQLESSVIG